MRSIFVVVALWKILDHQVGERRGDCRCRFVTDRKDSVEVAGRERELALADRCRTDPIDLFQDLTHRRTSDLALHRRLDGERPRGPTPLDCGERAVGVAVRLAEVEVDARGEETAEDSVHHRHGEIVGVTPWKADMAYAHLR